MQTTGILIIVDCENRNIVYPAAVAAIKNEVRAYFGSKNCLKDVIEQPMVGVTCEVTQEDIDAIKSIIDNDAINFLAIIGSTESEKVKGDIINLI